MGRFLTWGYPRNPRGSVQSSHDIRKQVLHAE